MKARQPTSGPSRVRLRHLYRFMSSRDFVAGRHELVALGFTPRQVDNWVRGGRLVRIFRSTYSYGRNPETRRALWRAALLVAGPGSALTGRSACEGWGFVEGRPELPRTIEVASTSGQARSFRGCSPGLRRTVVQVAHRSFGVDDVRTDGGLVLVQPSLALIDFAAEATDREVRFAFLDAFRTGNLTEKDLALSFERMVHRRGARKLRPYLELWRPELRRTKSVFEGWYVLVWIERGHRPMPKVNAKVFGYEVDLYWPDERFVLELDGESYHRGEVQRRIDLAKQRDLESRGLRVERLGFKEFRADPAAEVDAIASLLNRLSAQ